MLKYTSLCHVRNTDYSKTQIANGHHMGYDG